MQPIINDVDRGYVGDKSTVDTAIEDSFDLLEGAPTDLGIAEDKYSTNEALIAHYKNGDPQALATFLDQNRSMIKMIARLPSIRAAIRESGVFDDDDIYNSIVEEIIKAMHYFDLERNVKFWSYGLGGVRRNSINFARKYSHPLGKVAANIQTNIFRERIMWTRQTTVPLETVNYIDAYSGDTSQKYSVEAHSFPTHTAQALRIEKVTDAAPSLTAEMSDEIAAADDRAMADFIMSLLADDRFSERERRAIEMRFGSRLATYDEIKNDFGVTSREGARQIVLRAIAKLRLCMDEIDNDKIRSRPSLVPSICELQYPDTHTYSTERRDVYDSLLHLADYVVFDPTNSDAQQLTDCIEIIDEIASSRVLTNYVTKRIRELPAYPSSNIVTGSANPLFPEIASCIASNYIEEMHKGIRLGFYGRVDLRTHFRYTANIASTIRQWMDNSGGAVSLRTATKLLGLVYQEAKAARPNARTLKHRTLKRY